MSGREYTHWGVRLPHNLGLASAGHDQVPWSEDQALAWAADHPGSEVVKRTVTEWVPAFTDKVKISLMKRDPELGQAPAIIVQIDTAEDTGTIVVYLNDGDDPLYEGDPETD